MAEEKNPFHKEFGLINNLKYEFVALKKYSKYLVWLLPLGALISAVQRYLWTFLSKFIIDIITGEGEFKELLFIICVVTLLMIIFFILRTWYYNKKWPQCIQVRMKLILQKNLMMMTMPFEYTEDPDMQDCCQKAEQAVGGNQQGVEGFIHQLFYFVENLGVVIAGLVIIGTLNPLVVLGMTLLAVFNFLVSNAANKYSKKHLWDPLAPWWRKRWYMNTSLAHFEYAKDIRMFGLKNWLIDKFTELNKERYAVQKRNSRLWFWVGFFSSVLWIISQGAVYAYLIYRIFAHTITIGNFTLYLASTATFFDCITALLNTITQLLARSREVDDFRSFTENPKVVAGLERAGVNSDTYGKKAVPEYDSYEFQFVNVSFKYPRSEKYALKNLNVTVKAGERLAVVGLNGAGKSTFIKLLLRLYNPTEGQILLNGVDIQTYDINSYFSVFSPVFQEVNLFAFTLAENISMSSPSDTDRDFVQECVKLSDLEDKTNELTKGIDTQLLKVIYDDGIDLSGGQKQKLALARALYKKAPVVILDEPTAALDAIAESKLYNHFDSLVGNKTSIYISHRLSSTQFCNNVAMFKDGEMIEYGTHKSLMEMDGEYAKMFKVQSQYYLEGDENEER